MRVPALDAEEALCSTCSSTSTCSCTPATSSTSRARRSSSSACCRRKPCSATRSSARCGIACTPAMMIPGRRAGLSCRSSRCGRHGDWGIGEIGDLAPLGALAARRPGFASLQLLPINALPRARDVAVLGAQRDGDRSAVHLAGRRRRTSRRSAASARSRPTAGRSLAALRAAPRVDYRRRAALKERALRRAFERFRRRRDCAATPRARRRSRRSSTRADVVARRLRALPRAASRARRPARGPTGRRRCATGEPAALEARASRAGATRSSTTSTCSGSPTSSGRRRASAAGDVALFGDLPFMVAPTAPTSGRASTCSASTPRWACRPTRSARPGRTGACPSTAGT